MYRFLLGVVVILVFILLALVYFDQTYYLWGPHK